MYKNASTERTTAAPECPLFDALTREFCAEIGFDLSTERPSPFARDLISSLGERSLRTPSERRAALFVLLNKKLRTNEVAIKSFIDNAASLGVVFNYHEKIEVASAFNGNDQSKLKSIIAKKNAPEASKFKAISMFRPASEAETKALLSGELRSTMNRRTKVREPEKARDLALSLLGGYLYGCFDEKAIHQFNDPVDDADYEPNYWDRLHAHREHLFSRDRTLSIRVVTPQALAEPEETLRSVEGWLESEYAQLDNHGYAALILEAAPKDGIDPIWKIASSATLFAERFKSPHPAPGFFRGADLAREARECLRLNSAQDQAISRLYEGFLYKDCFVLPDGSENGTTLALLFQKNERDETPLPCPACRSHSVSTNSYPSLGIRSWECQNWICPDRSRANRGKRYAFWSLLTQQAVLDERNTISRHQVRKWSRDVVSKTSTAEVVDMLVRHYSLVDDGIAWSWPGHDEDQEFLGRKVCAPIPLSPGPSSEAVANVGNFRSLYLAEPVIADAETSSTFFDDGTLKVLKGDAATALKTLRPELIDGAVTSPPYYNAREYAQWRNIYCHMADMRSVAEGCFRALKPGAIYLYNVFDYFDNDNTVVRSAMGRRRIILSAYTADVFESVGFEYINNVVWDKGEIEGKRAFNGGNYSPFYQAPFNCWEHVMVFRKPGPVSRVMDFPAVLECPPVKKMVRGENRHGHTAPFPDKIPGLIIDRLSLGDVVLDPFGGSLTTGRVAHRHGRKAINIERDQSYCQLGIEMLQAERAAPALF